MIIVGLFIKTDNEYLRVDFFDDEKISITSSVQNIADISKTFTDFSQSFTVPASKQNNRIFKHWYESSIDSGFNSNLKVDAYIELDTIPFRNGKIQLEGATVKNGMPENYSINFIGNLTNLKDKFAGKLLKDLQSSTLFDFIYTPTVVKNKVVSTATSDFIMFPLISSDRYWVYGGSGLDDINDTDSPIRYNELFPAIKISAVLNMIEFQFGIDFTGDFLNDNKFKNAYLWLKNAEIYTPVNYQIPIDFTSISSDSDLVGYDVNLTTNEVKFASVAQTLYRYQRFIIVGVQGTSGVSFKIYLYKNGELFKTMNAVANGSLIGYTIYSEDKETNTIPAENDIYTFKISSNGAFTYTSQVLLRLYVYPTEFITTPTSYFTRILQTTQTLSGYTSIASSFPEIKIEDFFSGILKMFNMTCYSTDGINYTLERIDDYYNSGAFIDITKYIDIESNTNIQRVKTFKKINFEYEKSESIINVGFLGSTGLEYGSLSADTGYDGEEYSIKLPFEDLNFNNIGGGLLQVGYALKSDLAKYVPKAVILYDYNPTALTTCPQFYFNTNLTGGTSTAHTTYKAFGQETLISGETFSLNFGTQQSTLTNEIVTNGLYAQNYDNYLANIFNIKSRIIKIKTYLPTSILTSIKLNDRLIIRDKRYIINNMNLDLTTGEVQFELLNDFRAI